jgi:aminoglycoside phosphotransferase
MTLEELKRLIDQRVDERLSKVLGEFEVQETEFFDDEPDSRSLKEVFESVEKNRWTPPPGAKSSLELLREDRDS